VDSARQQGLQTLTAGKTLQVLEFWRFPATSRLERPWVQLPKNLESPIKEERGGEQEVRLQTQWKQLVNSVLQGKALRACGVQVTLLHKPRSPQPPTATHPASLGCENG
jgi:hypothetical protein